MTRDEVIDLISVVADQQQQATVLALAAIAKSQNPELLLETLDAGVRTMEAQQRPFGAQLLRRLASVLRHEEKTPPSRR